MNFNNPKPVIEDFDLHKCPQCSSFNMSRDISTNEFVCDDCHYSGKEVKRINAEEFKKDYHDKEKEAIEKLNKQNTKVDIQGIKDINLFMSDAP